MLVHVVGFTICVSIILSRALVVVIGLVGKLLHEIIESKLLSEDLALLHGKLLIQIKDLELLRLSHLLIGS
jgi:hypothetical protein